MIFFFNLNIDEIYFDFSFLLKLQFKLKFLSFSVFRFQSKKIISFQTYFLKNLFAEYQLLLQKKYQQKKVWHNN